jgi:hypothetical protein
VSSSGSRRCGGVRVRTSVREKRWVPSDGFSAAAPEAGG